MRKTVNIIVSGQVQGVCFRASTQKIARRLDVSGWVKNLPDGRVAIQASAEAEALSEFVTWCHRGPSLASVTEVVVEDTFTTEADLSADFAIHHS